MKLLLSNDDGVLAPGLAILAETLSSIAEIAIVAPDRNCSGAGNSLTLKNPLRYKTLENGAISVQGTPTDCVHLAINGLYPDTFDAVISGINAGANLAEIVMHSGTVAAAMEGCRLGLPAIAISLAGQDYKNFTHYKTAALIAKRLISELLENPLPPQTILNVNVPDVLFGQLQGYEITRLGKHHTAERMLAERDIRGNEIYWVGLPGEKKDDGIGTDFYAIANKRVSITPLTLDLTCHSTKKLLQKMHF
ncbi:MAG: 5'-nucleotidase SurE [Legionellaceae bacterium]